MKNFGVALRFASFSIKGFDGKSMCIVYDIDCS